MKKQFDYPWLPNMFPINREEDYHTHYVGKTVDGRQFFGYEAFVFTDGIPDEDWEKSRKKYVVLYIFDKAGCHIETKHWYAGTTSEVCEDIEVKPFRVELME